MSKSRIYSYFLFVGILAFALLSARLARAENAITPPTFAVVSTTPLLIESVTSTSVCGSTVSTPSSRQCIGGSSTEILANDTVGKLQSFVMGAGHLCGVDEHGVRCWSTTGTFEKPIQKLLSLGDTKRAQMAGDRICIPQVDNSILCYRSEQSTWVASTNGKSGNYKREIPPVQKFGPFKDLRDFDAADRALCAIDGLTVKCEAYAADADGFTGPIPPQGDFSGAKGISSTWDSTCVLSDNGLDCSRGSKADSVVTFHVEGKWKSAVTLFRNGYDFICAIDKDDQPMCLRLGDVNDETKDITPSELRKPDVRVLKFKASESVMCALTENTTSKVQTLLCGTASLMSPVENVKDVVDFGVSPLATCVVNSQGVVTCFRGTQNTDSPLPDDGSKVHSSGKCRWNNSRFHCANTSVETDFSEFAKIISATKNSEKTNLPCIIYENRAGIRNVRCFGDTENLLKEQPTLTAEITNIVSNFKYGCAYGGSTMTCWGAPLGGQPPPNISNVKKIYFGEDFGCVNDKFGFACWGSDLEKRNLTVPPGLGDLDSVRDFGVGQNHVCAITRDSQVLCWGSEGYGQIDVPPLTNPTSVIVTGNTNCAY